VFDEAALSNGDTVQWGGAVLVYGRVEPAVIEELHDEHEPLGRLGKRFVLDFREPQAAVAPGRDRSGQADRSGA